MNKKLLFCAATMMAGIAMAALTSSPGTWTRSKGASHISAPVAPTTISRSVMPMATLASDGDEAAETAILTGYPRSANDACTIIDANGDANGARNTWAIESVNDYDLGQIYRLKYEAYGYGTPTPADYADDWAIMPVTVDVPSRVRISFSVKSQNTQDHTFDVWFGTAPTVEGMTTKLKECNHNGGSSSTVTEEITFDALEAGTYYVGFHSTYYKSNGKLYIYNVNAYRKDLSVINLEPGDVVFSMHPTQEEFDGCTIIDGNNDGQTITYYYVESGENIFDWPIYYINAGAKADADEWIITPAVSFPKNDALYQLQIDARSGATGMPEAFEVCVGTAPTAEAMTRVVINESRILNTDYSTFAGKFGIETPGNYYIGVHIKSPLKGSWRMMLKDLRLTYTELSASVPLSVTDLRVTPEANGALYANVEFTMPSRTVNGRDLDASTPLIATVTTDAGSVTVYGMPGSPVAKFVETKSGINEVMVSVRNDNGEGTPVKTTVRCGIDIPVEPTVTSKVSDNNMSVTMTWEPVSEGVNGGIVLSKDVKYNVYQYVTGEDDYGNVTAGWNIVASDLADCKYTYTTRNSTQQLYEFMITSKNSAGESDGSIKSAGRGRLGTLYSLPFAENFTNGQVNYDGYVIEYPDDNYNASWGFVTAGNWTEAAGNVGSLAAMSQETTATMGRIALPKFACKNSHDLIASLRVWLDDITAPTDVFMELSTGEIIKIGHIAPDDVSAWTTFNFKVPESCGDAAWASLVLEPTFRSNVYCLMICAISVSQLDDYDLAIGGASMSNCVQGEPIKVSAGVVNLGSKTMSVPAAKGVVKNGSETIAEFDLTPEATSLTSGSMTTVSGTFTIDKADYVGKTISLSISLDGSDDNNTNNTVTTTFTLVPNEAPVVTDLAGQANATATGIVLTWTNPADIQNVESFEYLEHGVYGGKLAGWSNVDFDGKTCWTAQETPFPNATLPKAFQVVSQAQLGNGFTAHSGDRFLIAFSAQETLTDDWLISPEINVADGFSFWSRTLDSSFPETLEVLASSTDADFDSFETVQTLTLTNTSWRQHIINLPAGTRYVALHYCSYDQFGLMIDDIQYTPASLSYDIKGFNVYCNDECVARKVTASSYEHLSNAYSTNRYNVTVVASHNGAAEAEYPMSNTVCLALTGIDGVNGEGQALVTAGFGFIDFAGFAPAQTIAVYNTAGACVANLTAGRDGAAHVELPAGVYMISASGTHAKVLVR